MKTKLIFIVLLLLLPVVAFAQQDLGEMIDRVGDLVFSLIPVAFALAVLFFLWGLAKFILKAGDESAREEGKQIMKWGIVALFVIVSMWGIIGFLRSEFSITGDGNFPIPRL
jgi:uncharacterized membrane protein